MKLFLVGGEDSYHAEQKLLAIKANLTGLYPNLQVTSHYGDEISSLNQLHGLVGEVGFFAANQLLICRQFIGDLRSDLKDQLVEIISAKLSDASLHLVFFERSKIDKRSKLYKLVKERGEVFEFALAAEWALENFIKDYLWKQAVEISPELRRRLITLLAGQDYQTVAGEIDKLVLLSKYSATELNEATLLELINRERSQDIWELFSYACFDKAKAYELLDNILAQQVHHLQIIGYLALELHKLVQYYYFPEQLKPFIRNKIRPLAQRYSPAKLQLAVDKLLNLDLLLKSSNFDPRLGLTLYLSIL